MSEQGASGSLQVATGAVTLVTTVVMNRPEALNALNTDMGQRLLACFERLATDEQVRAVVLTGAGNRAFCAGGDFKERASMTPAEWRAQHQIFENVAEAITRCPVPTIAAVEGFAFGGGCELAALCDMVVASESAVFALPEVTLGIFPGVGGTQVLPRRVSAPLARELIFTGRRMTAEEAFTAGMVNRLVKPGESLPTALTLAERIAANAPIAVRQAKRAINFAVDANLREGMAFAVEAYNVCVDSEDRVEGLRAFAERRAPRFKGT